MTAGVALAVVLGEAVLRVQEPYLHLMLSLGEHETNLVEHPVWDHWLEPGINKVMLPLSRQIDPRPIVLQVNSDGCRYPRDLEVPRPPGLRRIIVIGDSFTMGYYEEDTFAHRLQSSLNGRWDGWRYEVINCGTTSYSPMLYYLRFKHQLLELQPQYLVVNVDQTDLQDDYDRYRPRADTLASGEPVRVTEARGAFQRLVTWLKYRSYAARLVITATRLSTWRLTMRSEVPYSAYHDGTIPRDSEQWRAAAAYSLSHLDRLVSLARQSGVRVVLTTYPHRHQIDEVADRPRWHRAYERALADFAAERGLPFYSAFEALEQVQKSLPLYWQNDIHLTPLGQYVWSGLVVDWFLKQWDAGLSAGPASPPGR